MARKDRAPNPPKRPQAPQRRSTPSAARSPEQMRKLLYVAGGSVLAALALVLAFFFLGRGGDEDVAAAFDRPGCSFQSVKSVEGAHTAAIDASEDPKWNTDPPTSGPHYEVPAVYGSYEEPLSLAQLVHNLEHGAVYVLYGPKVPEETVDELQAFYDDDPTGMLLAPLPSLGDKIALGAWTVPEEGQNDPDAQGTSYLAKCTAFEEDAFEAFRDEYRFHGPERFPPELLAPGST